MQENYTFCLCGRTMPFSYCSFSVFECGYDNLCLSALYMCSLLSYDYRTLFFIFFPFPIVEQCHINILTINEVLLVYMSGF